MLGGLIAVAIGYGMAAFLKKFAFKGQPISWPMAFAVGIPILIVSLAIAPKIFDMSGAAYFPPLVVAMLVTMLTQGYTGKSREKSDSTNKAQTDSPKQPAPQKPAEQPKKKEPVKTEKQPMSSSHDDEKFYEQVATELKDGNTKQGLWLKAETKAEGDKEKTRLQYIEWRVEQLAEEEREAERQEEEREAQGRKETIHRMRQDRKSFKGLSLWLLDSIENAGYVWKAEESPVGGFNGWSILKSDSKRVFLNNQDELEEWVLTNISSSKEEYEAQKKEEERIAKEAEELEAKKKEKRLIRDEEESKRLGEKIRLFAKTSSDSRIDLEKLLAVLEEAGYSHDGKSKYVDETCCTLYKKSADYGYGAAPRKDKVGTFKNIGELREWVKINFPQ